MMNVMRNRGEGIGWWAMGLVAVLCLLAAPSVSWAEDDDSKLPPAEKILDKTIEAQGGKAAFEKLNTRVASGTIEALGQGIKGSFTEYAAKPNNIRVVVEWQSLGKEEHGCDGELCWSNSEMMGPRVLTGKERAAFLRDATFNAGLKWRELYEKVETVGKGSVEGRSCYKVKLTPADGNPITLYFERKTGLPIRMETVQDTPMGPMPMVSMIENYKEVDGIKLPFKMTQEVGSMQKLVIEYKKIEHNVDVSSDRFDAPEVVKQLAEKPGIGSTPSQP